MDRCDIAIIGTGPAGVSAAITAKVRNKYILLFGSRKSSERVYRATQIQNYPGLPQISGEELAEQYQKQLDQLGIAVTEERVSAVYAMGSYFVIQASGKMSEASSVILGAGVVQGKTLSKRSRGGKGIPGGAGRQGVLSANVQGGARDHRGNRKDPDYQGKATGHYRN